MGGLVYVHLGGQGWDVNIYEHSEGVSIDKYRGEPVARNRVHVVVGPNVV